MPASRRAASGRLSALVLAETTGLALQATYCLHALKARIFIVGRPGTKLLGRSRYCKDFVEWDYHPQVNDPRTFSLWLKDYIRQKGIDIVVPIGDLGMSVIAAIRGDLPVPTFPIPSVAVCSLYNDKWAFYELCVRAGVPVPRSLFFKDRHEITADQIERAFGFPCVVKPTQEGDREGVEFCRSPDELRARILDNPGYDYSPIIVQELIQGREIDLNALSIKGGVVASSVQYREGKQIVFEDRPAYVEYGARVLAAKGYEGLAHFDAIEDSRDGKIKFLECNARSWGSIGASAFCGLNFFEGGISYALGNAWTATRIRDGSSYLPPAHAVLSLLGIRRASRPISRATLRGLACALGDPVPFACEYLRLVRAP
ncbi:MAG: ATP-grasp domain-containing protein [Alphaproteobacteria bacterium]